MYKPIGSPSSRFSNPENSPSQAMYSLKTDDILGASPKKHAYQKADILNQYISKLGPNSPSVRSNPNAINYWPYPVRDQGNHQNSPSLPQNASFSTAVQHSNRIAIYDSANDSSRQVPAGSHEATPVKSTNKTPNVAAVMPNVTKMRNPMYADFDYSIYKSSASANNSPMKRKAHVEDSLDVLQNSMRGRNHTEVDSGTPSHLEHAKSLKGSLKVNDLSSPSSVRNMNKKGVTFEQSVVSKDESRRESNRSSLDVNNQLSTRAHSETPRKFFKTDEEIKSLRLRQNPSQFYTLNPLTQSPMLRYQGKMDH